MQILRQGHPVSACCEVLGLARSSYYYAATAPCDDRALRSAIEAIAGRYPTYGSRRIKAELARAPYFLEVGRKRVRQMMHEMKLLLQPRQRKPRTTDSGHGYRRYPNLLKGSKATCPDQIWVADISYIRLASGFAYLAVVMDLYTRMIRGWELRASLSKELVEAALKQAMQKGRAPAIHHSDQGGQYFADAYLKLLRDKGVQVSMAAAGKPQENGCAERLMRTIKEEEVYLSSYDNIADAREQLRHFIDVVYPHRRVHSALGYRTPAEFEAQWYQNPPSNSGKKCPVLVNHYRGSISTASSETPLHRLLFGRQELKS